MGFRYWQETGRNEAPNSVGGRLGPRGEFSHSRRNTSIRTHSFRTEMGGGHLKIPFTLR